MPTEAYEMLKEGFLTIRQQYPQPFTFAGQEYIGVLDDEQRERSLDEGGVMFQNTAAISILKADFTQLPKDNDLIEVNGATMRIVSTENIDVPTDPLATLQYESRS